MHHCLGPGQGNHVDIGQLLLVQDVPFGREVAFTFGMPS
jgi:hypothetical protein